MPCGTDSDQSAATGTRYLPLEPFSAPRPFTSTVIVWVVPGAAYALMSKFDGVNAVVWVATTRPSTDSVAWWLTAPNSIQVDCGCPESGTVMLREYTASFTSVKPCLYQPPPGTVIDVAPRPAGVKPHVPLRSTEAIAAFPAATPSAPAAATAPVAPGAARAGPWVARVRPPRTTAAASPPAAAGNQPRRRTFERCMPTSHDSSASSAAPGQGTAARPSLEPFDESAGVAVHPEGWLRLGCVSYEFMAVSRHSVSPAHRPCADRTANRF